MDKKTATFLAHLQSVSLSDPERLAMRAQLLSAMGTPGALALLKQQQIHKEFSTSASSYSLTTLEKAEGLAALQNFVQKNPITIKHEPFLQSIFHRLQSRLTATTALAFSFVFLTGAGAYGAEKAMPGDTLYPIKLHVYEPITGALHLTQASQERWKIDRFNMRLQEAEHANSRGDHSSQEDLARYLDRSAQEIEKNLANEKNPQNARMTRQVIMTLKKHERFLQQTQDTPQKAQKLHHLVEFINRDTEVIDVSGQKKGPQEDSSQDDDQAVLPTPEVPLSKSISSQREILHEYEKLRDVMHEKKKDFETINTIKASVINNDSEQE